MSQLHTFEKFVWASEVAPAPERLDRLAERVGLDVAGLRAVEGRPLRPTLAAVGEQIFLSLDVVQLTDGTSALDFEHITFVVGPEFLVVSTARDTPLARELCKVPGPRDHGDPITAMHVVLNVVIDHYLAAIEGIDLRVREIERAVLDGNSTGPLDSITRTRRAIADLEHITTLATDDPLERFVQLRAPAWVRELSRLDDLGRDPLAEFDLYLRRIAGRVTGLRILLDNAVDAIATRVDIQQNEDARKISAWVAIYAIPTLLAGIYGMNFDHMPELRWSLGYPLALLVMAAACVVAFLRFRRNGWL